ncbi:MAG: hypothetical protein IK145_05075, partial [Bacteroidales bacterium]|nr:hypothetical protein [Bacteroidales bacterium]
QDQTLLCIYTYKILSQIPTAYILPKEINALVLVLGTFACTSFSLFNELACCAHGAKKSHSTRERDCKGKEIF